MAHLLRSREEVLGPGAVGRSIAAPQPRISRYARSHRRAPSAAGSMRRRICHWRLMSPSPITIGAGNGARPRPIPITPAQGVAPPAQGQPAQARQAELVICDQTIEPLFAAVKHGWRLKDAWQQSRQGLMRWVTILAAGYALGQMLAYTDPARIPDLAAAAPWRPPGTRTAGLIQAGLARLLRGVGPSALMPAIRRKSDLRSDRPVRRRASADPKAA